MATDIAIEAWKAWVGNTESRLDWATLTPVAALSATLNRDDPWPHQGDPLPPLWHWLYFLPIYPLTDAGPDGHAQRGGFLPPVTLRRRMWAGGRFEFKDPLRLGDS